MFNLILLSFYVLTLFLAEGKKKFDGTLLCCLCVRNNNKERHFYAQNAGSTVASNTPPIDDQQLSEAS
jgi:hypothetical protein